MEEEIEEAIERINKLNSELCEHISDLEQDVESLQNYREALKYAERGAGDRHIRRQKKVSVGLQLLLSTTTTCCLIRHQQDVPEQEQNVKKEQEATETRLDASFDV